MAADQDFILKDTEDGSKGDGGADETGAKNTTSGATSGSRPDAPLPTIDFSTFIMSLNASALVNLGIIEDPGTGKKEKNLPLGKQTIDIISMLEDKTRGNLSTDEAKLLKGMLYDLRMTFVKQSR